MPKEAVFTLKLETELRDKFMAEAEAMDRPASQVMREMMREFIHKKEEEREYEKWFLAEVEEAVREADDPHTEWIPHDEVMARVRAAIEDEIAKRKAREG